MTRLDHEDGDGDGDGDDGDPIDDRQSEREPTPESTSVAAPSGLVCPDCGGQFDLGTPAPARGDADEGSGGMRDLAGLVPLPHALAHGEPRSWTVQGAWRCEADGNAIEPRRVD